MLDSVNFVASHRVEHEIETAPAREQEQKRTMLFPVRLDDAVMAEWTGKMPILLWTTAADTTVTTRN